MLRARAGLSAQAAGPSRFRQVRFESANLATLPRDHGGRIVVTRATMDQVSKRMFISHPHTLSRMTQLHLTQSIVALTVATLAASPVVAQNQLWLAQFGTIDDDQPLSAARDGAGGLFLGGETRGDLNGANAGHADAWFARYDSASGNRLWVRQLGTAGSDAAQGVAPDGSGGGYVCGHTQGSLGGPFSGATDVWLAHFDSAGSLLWLRQLGSSDADFAFAATSDGAAGMYLTGSTDGSLGGPSAGSTDAWLARYDAGGNQLWIRQLGTDRDDGAYTAAADGSGGVYIAGATSGSLGGANAGDYDAWLARYDAAGNQLWIRQLGVGTVDAINAAAPDASGGVCVGGHTLGSLGGANAGAIDAWLARYDAGGNQLWIRQLGTNAADGVSAASLDGSGGVHVIGFSFGDLAAPNAGGADVWLAHYDGAGNQRWIRQFGTSAGDYTACAAPDGSGGVHLGGATYGEFVAPNLGGLDAWLARYDSAGPPHPVSYCTASTTGNGCSASISANAQPSVSFTTQCTLSIANVEGQRQGLIFYGVDNTGFSPLPWSSGSSSFLCVKPPTQRTSIQNSGGVIASCNGTLSLDWNAFHAANPGALGAPFTAGSKVYAQGWFRDPPAPKSTNLSNALELTVVP